MREHYNRHGINAFEFIKHKSVLDVNVLTEIENEAMFEFIKKGYSLYNTQQGVGNIFCQRSHKGLLERIIEALSRDESLCDKLDRVLNEQ